MTTENTITENIPVKEALYKAFDDSVTKVLNKEMSDLIKKYKELESKYKDLDDKLDGTMRRIYFLEALFRNKFFGMNDKKIKDLRQLDHKKLHDSISDVVTKFYKI